MLLQSLFYWPNRPLRGINWYRHFLCRRPACRQVGRPTSNIAVPASHPLLVRLAALANPDGGWGYHAGKASHPEPTCLALLAFGTARDPFAQVIANGLAALERNHQPDGGYRLTDGRPEAGWPTAIALFTKLGRLGGVATRSR